LETVATRAGVGAVGSGKCRKLLNSVVVSRSFAQAALDWMRMSLEDAFVPLV